jgi:hypothetical protein
MIVTMPSIRSQQDVEGSTADFGEFRFSRSKALVGAGPMTTIVSGDTGFGHRSGPSSFAY